MSHESGTLEELLAVIASLKREQARISAIDRPLTEQEARRLDQIAESLLLLTAAADKLSGGRSASV